MPGARFSRILIMPTSIKRFQANGKDNKYDGFGALGNGGSNANLHTPDWVDLGGGLGTAFADSVAFGNHYGCAIHDAGSLKCWGKNGYGQVGDGTTTDRNAPVAISLGTGRTAEAVAVHGAHTCAILDDDSVKCWGDDTWGDLGNGAGVTHSTSPPSTSVNFGTGRAAVALDIGMDHSCAIQLLQHVSATIKGHNACKHTCSLICRIPCLALV